MSLETKIDTLTAAIVRLTDALEAREAVAAEAPAEKPKKAPSKAETKKAEKEVHDKVNAALDANPKAGKAVARDDETPVTKAVIGQALIALMKAKGQDAGAKALKEFGANKVGELKEEDYPAVLAAIEKAAK